MKYLGKLKTKKSNEISENSRVSIGFECVDRDLIKPEKCYDLIGNSGIKYARCQTGWAKTEKEKGIYDFSWLDSMVDNLLKRGVQPWFNVGYGNPLYMGECPNSTGVGCVPLLYSNEVLEAWKTYVKELADHFNGRVNVFEIWNEPDLGHFWYPGNPNPEKYAEFLHLTARVIKNEIPDAKTGSCTSGFNPEYIERVLKNVLKDDIDFHCYHTYRIIPEQNCVEEAICLRKIFNRNGFEHVELWQGEGGRASHFPENYWLPGQSSEHQQAVWQLRRFILDIKCGLKLTSYFQIADMYEKPYEMAQKVQKRPAAQGILNGLTYTPKKSYETICRIATILSDCIEMSDDMFVLDIKGNTLEILSRITISTKKNGHSIYFYWLPYYVEEEKGICGSVTAYFEKNDIENPVIVDLFTGEVSEFDFKVSEALIVTAKELPIAEYPMVICDKSIIEIETEK